MKSLSYCCKKLNGSVNDKNTTVITCYNSIIVILQSDIVGDVKYPKSTLAFDLYEG